MCLELWNLGFNLKGKIMLKSAKRGLQGTWAPKQWRPSGCFLVVWLVTMVSMLFSESKGLLLGEF